MPKKLDEWMPFYIGRYLGDTMHLSYDQHGPYMFLLFHYWRQGPLPDDDKQLAAIARVPLKIWKRDMAEAIRAFFTLEADGKLHQKKCDFEREKRHEIGEKRSAAGRVGAEVKHGLEGQVQSDGQVANATRLPPVCHVQVHSTITVPASQGAEAPRDEQELLEDSRTPAEPGHQGSLLPPDPGDILRSTGPGLLAGLMKLSLDLKGDRGKVWALFNSLRTEAADDAILLSILTDTAREPPRNPVSWIKGQIVAKQKTAGLKGPTLFVDNSPPDPTDNWGIKAFCNGLVKAGRAKVEDVDGQPKCRVPGAYVNDLARTVAEKARLHRSWRGDWSALVEWLEAGITGSQIYTRIEKRAGWHGYDPPQSIRFFDGAVRTATVKESEAA
jgi:uncharacterized protein YdaU (DUF1376 family)